jgi:hypothetical protein
MRAAAKAVLAVCALALAAALFPRCGDPMEIEVARPLRGVRDGALVPAGTYKVSVDEARGAIVLTNAAGAIALDAKKRPSKVEIREPSARLWRARGEDHDWLLVVKLPPVAQWTTPLVER